MVRIAHSLFPFAVFAVACSVPDAPAAAAVDASQPFLPQPVGHAMTSRTVAPMAGDASRASRTDPGFCTALCARSAGLHCPAAAACVKGCEDMRALPGCEVEVRGAIDCFLAAPTTAWTCNPHGLPSIEVGRCDAEQARAAKCLATLPPVPSAIRQ